MSDKKILILNQHQIEQKIDRIAYQLLEDNYDEEEIIIAGILPKGNYIAERLKKILDKIAPFKSTLITIELDKQSSSLKAKTDTDMQICHNKAVILVDDVLNSGKTLIFGAKLFLNAPVKRLTTAVLVDRGHNRYPIKADVVGLSLSTTLQEHITVELKKGKEVAYLS